MSRLEKKCVIASAGCHLLLLLIIVFGSAFVFSRREKPEDFQVLTVIPDITTDKPFSGGGTPDVKPPPPAVPRPEPAPAPPTIKPEPKSEPKKIETPEPEPTPRPVARARSEVPDVVDTKPKKPALPDVSTELVSRKPEAKPKRPRSTTSESDAAAEAKSLADARRRSREFRDVIRSLKEGATDAENVGVPGTGGGPSYANYRQAVYSIYLQAWLPPDSVTDEAASAIATITIARDGSVISSRITRSSGNAAVDVSVQRTLDRVRFIAPFPEGAREERRTYFLEFNLKAKRSLG